MSVSIHVSCPTSSSIGIACVFFLTSVGRTFCLVTVDVFPMRVGSCVGRPFGFFCVVRFILGRLLPPTWPCVVFFFFITHFYMSIAQGLFCPASKFVLSALSLDLLGPSIQQANPRPRFVYPTSSHNRLVVDTPSLDPSLPATTFCGAWPKN
jgi:hypothetical protein